MSRVAWKCKGEWRKQEWVKRVRREGGWQREGEGWKRGGRDRVEKKSLLGKVHKTDYVTGKIGEKPFVIILGKNTLRKRKAEVV